ncbi:MAG: hypothetical protein BroJett040_09050 [Oligoflexia bacterium]|nr:MAG: hypothetical protein BroJett040_09050 [Oligoflexia bacterium]
MKKLVLAITAFVLATSGITPAYAQSCETEIKTLESMNAQLDAINDQVALLKYNRNSTSLNGAFQLFWAAAAALGRTSGEGRVALALGGAAALSGVSVYLTQQQVEYFSSVAQELNKMIASREADIKSSNCLGEKVAKSKKQNARELYNALVAINNALAADVTKLKYELGNAGTSLTTFVSVGSSVMLVTALGLYNYSNARTIVDLSTLLARVSVAGGFASPLVAIPSLTMSTKEARVLLAEVQKTQASLLAQEKLLREILE